MWKPALIVVALLVAGCADETPTAAPDAPSGAPAAAPFLAKQAPMQFASGAFEDNMTGEATYSITDQAILGVNDGEVIFDLTPIIPAEAPVEMTITLDANANLEFIEATATGDTSFGTDFAFIVVRAPAGQVLLHVYNPGGFFPPNPAPTATFNARAVVRPDAVNPGIPVIVKLGGSDVVNVTGEDIDQVLVLDPQGTVQRIEAAPFMVAANGTAGDYTLLVMGEQPVQLLGPDTTLRAKRLVVLEEAPHALTSGAETTWSVAIEGRPLAAVLVLEEVPTTPFFGVATAITAYDVEVLAPDQTPVIAQDNACQPACGMSLLGGLSIWLASEELDPALTAGSYQVSVTYTGNNLQAYTLFLVIN